MIILQLFFVFFKISLFAVGGAYSFLPLLEKELINHYRWLTAEEFVDVLGIVNIIPGAISIKYATYTGYKLAGFLGVVTANLGNLLPATLLIFFSGRIYLIHKNLPYLKDAFKGVQLAVLAMLLVMSIQLLDFQQLRNLKSVFIMGCAFVLFFCTKIHPAFIIIGAGLAGLFFNLCGKR